MCQTLLNLTLYCYRYSKTYITERETMSKLDKEFKQDVDKEVREGTYIVVWDTHLQSANGKRTQRGKYLRVAQLIQNR